MLFRRTTQAEKLKKEREAALFDRVKALQEEHVQQQHLTDLASEETTGGCYYRKRVAAKYNYLYKITRKVYSQHR